MRPCCSVFFSRFRTQPLAISFPSAQAYLVVAQQRVHGLLGIGVPHPDTCVKACRNQVVKGAHDHHAHHDVRVPLERHHFLPLIDIPPCRQKRNIKIGESAMCLNGCALKMTRSVHNKATNGMVSHSLPPLRHPFPPPPSPRLPLRGLRVSQHRRINYAMKNTSKVHNCLPLYCNPSLPCYLATCL